VPQDKIPGHDLWEHTLATLDAAASLAPDREVPKLAALLHDVGKPETFADGRFFGHDEAGARIAREVLARLAFPARAIDHVCRLIRHHMFSYEPTWSDAAVRRFMRRVGDGLPEDRLDAVVDDLLDLRRADNLGSGRPIDSGGVDELRARVRAQREAGAPLTLRQLAVDGHDLQQELERPPGPWLGRLLDRLLESVVADPARNTRVRLMADARRWNDDE
jgi:tRNA nucleotidyltransferase (CCA-adding enzyme)